MSHSSTPEQRSAAMDAAVVGDSFPQVSNLLRRFANSTQPQVPSKLGLSPLSLRERLLTNHDMGGLNLTSAESRSSSDVSVPFENDLQSLWDQGGPQSGHQLQQQQQQLQQQLQQQQQQQHPQYEGSPLNPNAHSQHDSLRQLHLRQQLGVMAAALIPRSGSLPPTDSVGSGDSRPTQKRRWADCLETNSLPSSSPGSPPGGIPQIGSDNPLMLEGSGLGKDEGMGGPDARRKETAPAENSTEWEPRVRRKRGSKGGSGSVGPVVTTDDEACASDGDGVVRIKAKSMTERQRRDRISDALRRLRGAVNSHGDMATMLNEAVDLIQQQKRRVEELEMQILQQRLRQQLAGGCRTLF